MQLKLENGWRALIAACFFTLGACASSSGPEEPFRVHGNKVTFEICSEYDESWDPAKGRVDDDNNWEVQVSGKKRRKKRRKRAKPCSNRILRSGKSSEREILNPCRS